MYTHTINKIVGNRAFVTLHKATDETETYTEQVTVSDAVFATEESPFIPPVFELVEHTRPKVIHTDVVVTFTNQSEIPAKVQEQIDLIENPPQPVPTPEPIPPTEEELAQQAFYLAKQEWLTKKQALATMIDDMDRGSKLGIVPDETQVAIMTELAGWVNANMKKEYYF